MPRLTWLALAPILLAGCGRSAPAPASAAAVAPAPAPDVPTVEAAPDYELDPARHALPSSPLAGRYAGRAVAPAVALSGPNLVVRVPPEAEGKSGTELRFKLAKVGGRLVVRPEQPPGEGVPVLAIDTGAAMSLYENGYSLTLELGEVAGGVRPGKMYLALPDAEKSFLAGAFRAGLERDAMEEPPGPGDAPYLAGSLTLPAGATGALRCGLVGVGGDAATGPVLEEVEFKVTDPAAGTTAGVSQNPNPPRASALVRSGPGRYRYEHTKLPAGRYLVYCRLEGGPCAFAYADLGPAGATLDFALDPAKLGGVRVTVPKALGDAAVQLVPVDPAAPPGAPDIAVLLDSALKLGAKANPDGVATIERVPAGAYTVRVAGREEPVTIVAGRTAAVEVK